MFLNFNYITCNSISGPSGFPSIIVKMLPQVNIYNNVLIKAVHSAFRCSTAVGSVLNCETSSVASEFTLVVSAPDLWSQHHEMFLSHWGNFGA